FNPFTMDSASALHRQRAISLGMADLDMSNVFSPFDTSHSPIQSYQSTRYRMQHDQLPMMTSLSSNNIAETFHQQEEMVSVDQDIPDSPTSAELQIPSRALWLGNINPSVSVPDLIQIFSAYGQVDSARILSDKECAFVNFTSIKSAVVAKTDLETRLGSKLVGNPVRVGYGKADVNVAMALSNEAGPNAQGPTRALWVGNIPANMNPNILRAIFQQYGPIDSIRVLSHKNCGFVNFIYQEDAVRARKNLQNKEILGPGTGTVRIGFARAPDESDEANPPTEPFTQMTAAQFNKLIGLNVSPHPSSETISPSNPSIVYTTQASERLSIMRELGYEPSEQLKVNRVPIHYYPVIPAVPEISTVEGNMEPFHLRELRKRLENAGDYLMEEVQSIVTECLPMIVELCSGNTIIQKLFEYGSEQQRLSMLKKIAPYLASIGVHKNGTWAAQKIIDFANTPDLIQLVNQHIAPYVPLLLLDQFGNYVVQCCLRKGSHDNQYIFDAIVDKCWEIGQGRFGARAIRAILDNNLTTTEQRVYISSAIVQNIVLLTTNANGVLLVTWLLDSSELPNRYRVTCPRLSPYLSKLSLHKLGSMTLSKIVHQTEEPNASALIMNSLSDKSKAEIAKR
ncbi:armadillo-type protein, partial [Pilobolus umbonatus]